MTSITHASLTGAELHEPKGITTAPLGTVYVSNGAGSGSWSGVGASSFTGMIADFTWPVVQSGWLELDGSDINTTTYAGLYNVMTIQQSGARNNGSNIISGLSTTVDMRVGYYVFGAGIASGTTIVGLDSGTQITLSNPSSSSGTATVVISPWLINAGTIRLPNVSAAGRYRRSRSSSTAIGQLLDHQNASHTHTVSGTTANDSGTHTHLVSGNTGNMSGNATHAHVLGAAQSVFLTSVQNGTLTSQGNILVTGGGSDPNLTTSVANIDHTHAVNITSGTQTGVHTHTFSTTTDGNGGSEARPVSMVVMTCVKT